MPFPSPLIPKTHAVMVNLGAVLDNMQRAVNTLFARGIAPAPPEAVSTDSTCRVRTLDELRAILKPALQSRSVRYERLWQEGVRYSRLTYLDADSASQPIVVGPTEIIMTPDARICNIDRSLSLYFSAAVEIVPSPPVNTPTDAAMIGLLRCMSVRQSCEDFMKYAPEVQPSSIAARALPASPGVPPLPPRPPVIPLSDHDREKIASLFDKLDWVLAKGSKAGNGKLASLYYFKSLNYLKNLAGLLLALESNPHTRDILTKLMETMDQTILDPCISMENEKYVFNQECAQQAVRLLIKAVHEIASWKTPTSEKKATDPRAICFAGPGPAISPARPCPGHQ